MHLLSCQFFQKWTQIFPKIDPKVQSEPILGKFLRSFLEELSQFKISFEINWPLIPHGMIWSNHFKSMLQFKARPWQVTKSLLWTPMAHIFLSFTLSTQTPVQGDLKRIKKILSWILDFYQIAKQFDKFLPKNLKSGHIIR